MHIRANALLAAAASIAALSVHLAAQDPVIRGADAPAGTLRRAGGAPSLSGVWMPPYVPDMTRNGRDHRGYAEPPYSPGDTPQARQALQAQGNRAELPFTPWGLQEWTSYSPADGDYTGSCFPMGLTRSMNTPYPFQIMQDGQQIAILFEANNWHHVIALDAEPPQDPNPTWFGHSVGRWQGDTLVVVTRGFNGYTRLDTIGHPHSDALQVTQTFTRTDADHIAYTVTIEDAKTYTKPWRNERVLTRINTPLIEYSCEENNKSLWEGRIKGWTPPWARPSPAR